uniref:Sperm-activating peptide (Asn-3, Ser-5 SAP-I) n=1 Tax=Echinometra mathaei TaxID=31178 RepID=Q7M4C5_ECHMA|nr:sperm-activating peptide I (3-Asn,5-Ser) [Echinometra mathaei]
GFNLSGGGVG